MSAPTDSAKFAEVLEDELRDIRKRRGEAPATPMWENILQQARAAVLGTEQESLRGIVTAPEADAHAHVARAVARFLEEVEKAAFRTGSEGRTDEQKAVRAIWDKAIKSFLHDTSVTELHKTRNAIRFASAPSGADGVAAMAEALGRYDRDVAYGVMWEANFQATRREALDMELVGLAFSGGGIRSATFNLGILQGLAELGMLPLIDYQSTVSGGGYIGSWLAAWVKRAGSVQSVGQQLKPSRVEQAEGRNQPPLLPADAEPEPINHLRAYSSYLAPRRGLTSADTWVLGAIYLRNVILNQLVIVPALMVLLLLPRFVVWFYKNFHDLPEMNVPWTAITWIILVASLGTALISIGVSVFRMDINRREGEVTRFKIQNAIRVLLASIVLPIFIFALLVTRLLSWDFSINPENDFPIGQLPGRPDYQATLEAYLPLGYDQIRALDKEELIDGQWVPVAGIGHHLAWMLLLGSFWGLLTGVTHILLSIMKLLRWYFTQYLRDESAPRSPPANFSIRGAVLSFCWNLPCVVLAGFLTSVLYYSVFGIALQPVYSVVSWDHAVMSAFGAPAVVVILVLGFNLSVGFQGTSLTEDVREWWASMCGWLLLYAGLWAAVATIALFGPAAFDYVGREFTPWTQAVLASTWLGTAIAGAIAGQSDKTSGKGGKVLEFLTQAVPPIFVFGLLLLISVLVSAVINNWPGDEYYYFHMRIMHFAPLCWWTLGLSAVALFMAYCIDVNIFSLHGLYANRLIRCYLGASRSKGRDPLKVSDRRGGAPVPTSETIRSPSPITGFDPNDDMPLANLRIGSENDTDETKTEPYTGPFVIINTALNLVAGDELAWQERKAESFVLTPMYCGSLSTGFRRLPVDDDTPLTLGNAVTLSGAAVSPNMGYHSSPSVGALLTVFNVRLGGWIANPRHHPTSGTGPTLGLLYLAKELFGRTNARSDFVYLSDGGHFENLGVYELVRRRCRFIISCDAGADPDVVFEDLGGLIRKCRTDFGIRIHIDVAQIRKDAATGFSRWHCAVGTIHYSDVDPGAPDGTIIYLKSSVTGDEPSDVLQYRAQHSEFPHTPTADQFFNETKFESYRALGYHVAMEVLCSAVPKKEDRTASCKAECAVPSRMCPVLPRGEEKERTAWRELARTIFKNLRERWIPPPTSKGNFLKSTRGYIELHESLRKDPRLHELTRQIYGALDEQLRNADDKPIVQLHVVSQMLQLMEDVFVGLQLDVNKNYPLYQGWMVVFRRWTNSEIFQRHWKTLQAEFSKDFQRFCNGLVAE